jgi:hypothetical protein
MMHRLSRFEAMPRLLDEIEIEELSRQPGFDPKLISRLRKERRRAYTLYLNEVAAEFHSLAKEAMDRGANDPNVEPDFVGSVVRVKARFAISLFLLRASLALPLLSRLKVQQMTVDLVQSLKPMAAFSA